MLKITIISSLISLVLSLNENVLETEVFEIVVNPPLFNWTYEGNPEQFVYQPSLLDAPDLPSWINYVFSQRHHSGFLYGVPPDKNQDKIHHLEIVALNRKTYETRHEKIDINIAEKLNPAKNEVNIKIDNLNVEDMFDVARMERLKDIFRKNLWKDSENDLYITLLASAIKLGARKPLNPSEGEGVVLRLGSQANLSYDLNELLREVKPLWKMPSCPRDFKRTSVERLFRNAGFAVDWCSFRLIEHSSNLNDIGIKEKLLNSVESAFEDRWVTVSRDEVPRRSYVHEFLFTMLIPMVIMVILAFILSMILCFHHEGISKRIEDASSEEISQYATIQRATQSLRGLSDNRDMALSPEPILLQTSPSSTVNRGVHCRPSPPPYVRPKYKPEL